jgi:hypothetical protein
MHWCMDETLAVLAMIPFIGYFFRKLHIWYHTKLGHTCHEKHCDSAHAEHPHTVEHVEGSAWDSISQEDVGERFGNDLVIFLYKELADIGILDISQEDVLWYVNDEGEVRAEVRGKTFLHDFHTCEWGWRLA